MNVFSGKNVIGKHVLLHWPGVKESKMDVLSEQTGFTLHSGLPKEPWAKKTLLPPKNTLFK